MNRDDEVPMPTPYQRAPRVRPYVLRGAGCVMRGHNPGECPFPHDQEMTDDQESDDRPDGDPGASGVFVREP